MLNDFYLGCGICWGILKNHIVPVSILYVIFTAIYLQYCLRINIETLICH